MNSNLRFRCRIIPLNIGPHDGESAAFSDFVDIVLGAISEYLKYFFALSLQLTALVVFFVL